MTVKEYAKLKTGDIIVWKDKEFKVVESLLDFNFTLMHIVENNGNRSIFNIGSMQWFNLKH